MILVFTVVFISVLTNIICLRLYSKEIAKELGKQEARIDSKLAAFLRYTGFKSYRYKKKS